MMRFLILIPLYLLKLLLILLVFLTPLLGVWLASSLVAYINGPVWLAVFSGVLLFPLIPITWDLYAGRNRKEPGILTWGDRIILRTLVLNLVFLIALLALRPQMAFLALSTRGDWMLDGRQGESVELAQKSLFQAANGLEWLYLSVHRNPYREYADTTGITPTPQPGSQPTPTSQPTASQPVPPPRGEQPRAGQSSSRLWPWDGVGLHPAVATMPASVETSIESVARYIAQQEKDPFLRVKALHDYVADRVAYDAPAFFGRVPRPPQDAETVFRTRKAVCAGYATLLEALGKAIGEEIVYLSGDSRTEISDLGGGSHAWNAAKIEGRWYLLDATWDSGYVNAEGFTKAYRTSYLFPPPDVMVISHFPDEAVWQLLPQPLSRGDFLRQPMLNPKFFANGLKLVFPTRSQTDVQTSALLQIENPRQRWLMASYANKGSDRSQRCMDQNTQGNQVSCPLPNSGTYEVRLYAGPEQYGEYDYIGQVEFNKG